MGVLNYTGFYLKRLHIAVSSSKIQSKTLAVTFNTTLDLF